MSADETAEGEGDNAQPPEDEAPQAERRPPRSAQESIEALTRSPVFERFLAQQVHMRTQMEALTRSPAMERFLAQQVHMRTQMEALTSSPAMERFLAQQVQMRKALLPNLERITEQLRLATHTVSRAALTFWPSNLRGIDGLTIEAVERVVLEDGIPLAGVPRPSIARSLVMAKDTADRRAVLGRRWREIAEDCHELLSACEDPAISNEREFALQSVAALRDGHFAAAQALAANLLDTILNRHLKADRVVLVPSRKVKTPEGYDDFVAQKFWVLAPIWSAYTQFFPKHGDSVPRKFARHATAHAVSRVQFSRRNAAQAVMVVSSVVGYLDAQGSSTL